MLFHFIVVILWLHTKHDNKLIAMQATLSYACGISDIPLKGETIGQNLRQIAAKFPERTALISEYQQYRANYSEFLEQVEQVAKALMAHGIRRGDRVGIWSPNRYEWVLVQYATALMGAIMVNINPGYKLSGLRYALEQSRIDLLIASSHFRKTDYIKMLDELRPDCLYPKQTVIIDRDWATFLSSASQVSDARLAEREASLQFDDPVNIQYTSGTTGYPKGATLSHHNILNNGFFIGERLKYTEKDIVCLPVPFYHCFGMVLGNMAIVTHGACIVIPGEFFDPEQVLQTVENGSARFRQIQFKISPNRYHGRCTLSDRYHAQGTIPDEYDRNLCLLRHDRDLSGFYRKLYGRSAGTEGNDGRYRPPPRRD